MRSKVLLAVVVLLLASIFASLAPTLVLANTQGTRADLFVLSINGTNVESDPVSGVKTDVVSPSTPGPYSVKIQNTALYSEDYSLEIKNIPANWTVIFTDTGTQKQDVLGVSSNSQKVVNILVSSTVYTTCNLTVTAHSKIGNQDKSDYILITCREDPLSISPDSSKKYAGAGSGVTFSISLSNNYAQAWSVDLGLSAGLQASDGPLGNSWGFKFDQSIFTLPASAVVTKNLTIFAPINGTPNDEKVFQIEFQVDGDSRVYYSKEIKCVIKEVYNLSISLVPSTKTANPGQTLNYTIRLVNNADNSDRVWIKVIGNTDSWPFEFTGAFNNLMEYFDIGAHQTKFVYVALLVPATAEAGQHELALNISGWGGTTRYDLLTNVNQTHKIELSYNTNEVVLDEDDKNIVYPVTLAPSEFRVVLKNKGNSLETAKIKVKDIESGWQVYLIAVESGKSVGNNTRMVVPTAPVDILDAGVRYEFTQDVGEVTLNIKRFFEIYLVLSVQAPSTAAATTHNFALSVEYGVLMFIPSFPVNMTLSISNIEIVDFDGDGQGDIRVLNPNATNKPRKFSLTIKNNYPLETSNFDVVLYVDSEITERDRVHIDSIQPGEEREVVLEWNKPESGVHVIIVKVKGQPITNEPKAQTQINVGSQSKDNTMFFILFIFIGLLILAIIIGTLIYLRIRSLGTDEDKEAQEYERIYGGGGKKDKGADKETEEYLHGAKYKSRKSERELEREKKKLYSDDEDGPRGRDRKKGGRRGRSGKDDETEEDPGRGSRGRRQGRGGRSRDRDDEDKGRRPSRDGGGRKKGGQGRPRRGKRGGSDLDDEYMD